MTNGPKPFRGKTGWHRRDSPLIVRSMLGKSSSRRKRCFGIAIGGLPDQQFHVAPILQDFTQHKILCVLSRKELEKSRGVSMKEKRVEEILLPFKKGVPSCPSVSMSDKITYAIELMVNNDLKCIAVVRNERPIGMVCLEDAFKKLGLSV